MERIRRIKSPAIGATIADLRYEADAGYVVIELDGGEELWAQADGEGYHVFAILVGHHYCGGMRFQSAH